MKSVVRKIIIGRNHKARIASIRSETSRFSIGTGIACSILLTSAWGQTIQTPPTVRDAYVRTGAMRVLSLKDYLNVVVCKSEYDAWQKDQKSAQALSLYINGLLMKGPEATRPIPPMDNRSDETTERVKADCAKLAMDAAAAAEMEARDKGAAAKEAADKMATEPDANKRALMLKDASDKDATAKDAVAKAAAARAALQQTRDPRYVMQYYLDSQFAAKPETKEPWIRLLQSPWRGNQVTVSVGPTDGTPWPSVAGISFERIHWWWFLGWLVLFIAAISLFVKFARESDIIRDSGVLAAPGGAVQKKAYSLAKTQMAVWTFLVAGALSFIFLVTWNENTLSNGVLVLIGISFGTTLLSATAEGQPNPKPSQGFITDLLSDGDGPSFHRYQMMLFTIILAAIFVTKAASALIMPDFDPTLLGLMGISSGAYLGFKLQEK